MLNVVQLFSKRGLTMDSSATPVETTSQAKEDAREKSQERLLPSGRSVVLKVAGDREELEVRSVAGEVEVRIILTEKGPGVNLRSPRIEVESVDSVAINCRRFELTTAERTDLVSAGDVLITGREMRVKTQGDIHMNGDFIHLNCEQENE